MKKSGKDWAHSWIEPGESKSCRYYVTEFEYLIPGYVAINDESLCAVHPVLSNRLGLRAPDGDAGVVYPLPEPGDFVARLNEI